MSDKLSVEKLVIDDSFVNYCFKKSEVDILYWERYIAEHPFESDKIKEAKQIVLSLHVVVKQEYSKWDKNQLYFEKPESNSKKIHVKKIIRLAAAVAAILIIMLIVKTVINFTYKQTDKSSNQIAAEKKGDKVFFYKTVNGEKRVITLADNTKIWLNAGSNLRIDEKYGEGNRIVYLSGEAFFDVIHDELRPFIVCTENFEVIDLGTVFNVKAYPGDEESETSLISGKLEIMVNNSADKISLLPNQKAIINNRAKFSVEEKESLAPDSVSSVLLLPLSYNQKDSTVIETAWTQSRLEIVNEDFYEMKEKLERWFGVKITVKDEEVGKYPFTATFEKENIQQVLQALQYAYHFNYSIKNNEVNISK